MALGVISHWNPLSTLSFHKENSAIAEGLVLLRGRILESSELGVLRFRYDPLGRLHWPEPEKMAKTAPEKNSSLVNLQAEK